MIMIRDIKLTVAASVLFEIYEITFAHMLENFKECWWDAIILDIIICNGLGMLVGWLWLRFWKCTEYNFLGYCDVVVESGGEKGKKIGRKVF
jgi:phosphatidylserine synthase 2